MRSQPHDPEIDLLQNGAVAWLAGAKQRKRGAMEQPRQNPPRSRWQVLRDRLLLRAATGHCRICNSRIPPNRTECEDCYDARQF